MMGGKRTSKDSTVQFSPRSMSIQSSYSSPTPRESGSTASSANKQTRKTASRSRTKKPSRKRNHPNNNNQHQSTHDCPPSKRKCETTNTTNEPFEITALDQPNRNLCCKGTSKSPLIHTELCFFGPKEAKRVRNVTKNILFQFHNLRLGGWSQLGRAASPRNILNNVFGGTDATVRCLKSARRISIPSDDIDKVFVSMWLDDRRVMFGTKCNRLFTLDTKTLERVEVPMIGRRVDDRLVHITEMLQQHTSQLNELRAAGNASPSRLVNIQPSVRRFAPDPVTTQQFVRCMRESPLPIDCGIHAIARSPSTRFLATGGVNTNELAIYEQCDGDFRPLALGVDGHFDWIFDATFLNEHTVLTGGRDGQMAIFNISDALCDGRRIADDNEKSWTEIVPRMQFYCDTSEPSLQTCKIRSLALQRAPQASGPAHVGVLTLHGSIFIHDLDSERQLRRYSDLRLRETVCLEYNAGYNMYMVGSRSHIVCIDPRMRQPFGTMAPAPSPCSGVRSLSIRDHLLTVGTGEDAVLLYDLRRFMSSDLDARSSSTSMRFETNVEPLVTQYIGPGNIDRNATYRSLAQFYQPKSHAVFTHSYDVTGTQLFVAGGPLPAGLNGSCVNLFK